MRSILLTSTLLALACGEETVCGLEAHDDDPTPRAPASGDPAANDPGAPADTTRPALTNGAQIDAFLEGRRLVMEGIDIPSHPNGFDENMNFGQATQCYHRSEMALGGGVFAVSSDVGTLMNAPETGDMGTCDRNTPAASLDFVSTSHLIENVRGDAECFDFTITYQGFGQEGRGRVLADGSALELELFFRDQATGHRCIDGDVGAATVVLNGNTFAGDAVQTFRIR